MRLNLCHLWVFFVSFFSFTCRKMGEGPCHWPWRDRHRNPAESGNPTRPVLEVSHDSAPSDLCQVQSVALAQRAAGGLWTQKHPTHAHTGRNFYCCSMLFIQMGSTAPPATAPSLYSQVCPFLSGLGFGAYLKSITFASIQFSQREKKEKNCFKREKNIFFLHNDIQYWNY